MSKLGSTRASRVGCGAPPQQAFSFRHGSRHKVRDGEGAKDSDQVAAATAPQPSRRA